MIKNPPARWETWVQSLGWEEPLEEGMATHSSILATHPLPKKGLKVIFWASLMAQMVKNLPAMGETWVQSLGREGPLGEGMATPSSFLARRIPMDGGAWQATVHEIAKSQTQLNHKAHTHILNKNPQTLEGYLKCPAAQGI